MSNHGSTIIATKLRTMQAVAGKRLYESCNEQPKIKVQRVENIERASAARCLPPISADAQSAAYAGT